MKNHKQFPSAKTPRNWDSRIQDSPSRVQDPSDSSDEDLVTEPLHEESEFSSGSVQPLVEQLSHSEISAPPAQVVPSPLQVSSSQNAPIMTVSEAVIRQVALPDIPLLPKTATKRLIAQWISQISNPLMTHPYHLYLTLEMRALIEIKFAAYFEDNPHETPCDYDKLSKEEFCRILTLVFSDVVLGTAVNLTLSRRLKNADVVRFSLADPDVENTTVVDIINIVKEFVTPSGISTISDSMHLESVKVLNDSLPKSPIDWRSIVNAREAKTVKEWTVLFLRSMAAARSTHAKAAMYGYQVTHGPQTIHNLKAAQKRPAESASNGQALVSKKQKILISRSLCKGCGRSHPLDSCHFASHPDFNSSSEVWTNSESGKAWAKRGKTTLPARLTLSGATHEFMYPPRTSGVDTSASPKTLSNPTSKSHTKGMVVSSGCMKNELASTLSSLNSSNTNLIPCTIFPLQGTNLVAAKNIKVEALLDTGSLAGDFLSQLLVDKYNLNCIPVVNHSLVRSGLNNNCVDLSKTVSLTVSYINQLSNEINSFDINAFILKETPIDLIVGLSTIKKYGLFDTLPSLVSDKVPLKNVGVCTGCIEPALSILKNTENENPNNFDNPLSTNPTLHASLINSADRIFGDSVQDLNQIPDKVGSFEPWLKSQFSTDDPLAKINISGSPEFRARIISLCEEFRHLFSDTLPPEPAKLKPFDIIVDDDKWEKPCNRNPPRRMAPKAQVEVQKQIAEMLKKGIIERSDATHYSQVLLVPKPGVDTFRMCIDFRNLNTCTKDASYPIPNIDQMFRRIGLKKPKYFGCMDLTQGYHQAPVSLSSRVYTAFLLFSGLYQFTRLPFGLKRAPSYFQEQMATIMVGLIYFICELYLDDILVFGETENQFITNLRTVFIRLDKHSLKLKAPKCFFGYEELEWVGKVISSEGLQMSRSRIQKLLDFPQPIVFKQLKSFLGFVNYFRDFIRNHSMLVKPLHRLLTGYKKTFENSMES